MSISRREIVSGLGVLTAIAGAGAVSACSRLVPEPEIPGGFFQQISQRRLEEAKAWLKRDARLSYAPADRQEIFAGPDNIVGELNNLIHSHGFSMAGDSPENVPGGMYWRQMGPWVCSDMMKGNAVSLAAPSTCEPVRGINETVLNVLVSIDYREEKIRNILLLENQYLMLQWGQEPG